MKDEYSHFSIISNLISTPFDWIIQLEESGIDYESITDYELFTQLFMKMKYYDTSLIFKDLKIENFNLDINPINQQMILIDKKHDIIIDKMIYDKIIEAIEKIYGFKKNDRKIKGSRAFILAHLKKKQIRLMEESENREPYLENLYFSLRAYGQPKEELLSDNIYSFNKLVVKSQKYIDYNHVIQGFYAGNIAKKDINFDKINWLS